MQDFNDRVNAINPDKFARVNTVVQGVASGFAAAQGAMALFGADSENLQKTMVKLQGAMALSQGLEGLGKIQQQFGAIFTSVVSGAKKAFAAIKAGIGSTGIGLLVVALGSIVAYWDDIKNAIFGVSEATKKAKEEQDKYNQSMKELNAEREILEKGELVGKQRKLNELLAEQNDLKIKQSKLQTFINSQEQGAAITQEQASGETYERNKKDMADMVLRNTKIVNETIRLNKDIDEMRKTEQEKINAQNKKISEDAKKLKDEKIALHADADKQILTLEQENELAATTREEQREIKRAEFFLKNAERDIANSKFTIKEKQKMAE